MIYLITGQSNQGKTRKIKSIYREIDIGDGIITGKIYLKNDHIGYKLEHLSTGKTYPFVYKKTHHPNPIPDCIQQGKFIFLTGGFSTGLKILTSILNRGIEPIFVDEIGPLELSGQGFAPILPKLIQAGTTLYLTIRSSCLEEFLKKYTIKDYQIINLQD